MKKTAFYSAVLISAAALYIAGCRGYDSNLVRRAQIIVSENAQLKQQIQDKDRQIADLMREKDKQIADLGREKDKQIAELGQEKDKQIAEMGQEKDKQIGELNQQIEQLSPEYLQQQQQKTAEIDIRILQMLADCQKQLDECRGGVEPNAPPAAKASQNM